MSSFSYSGPLSRNRTFKGIDECYNALQLWQEEISIKMNKNSNGLTVEIPEKHETAIFKNCMAKNTVNRTEGSSLYECSFSWDYEITVLDPDDPSIQFIASFHKATGAAPWAQCKIKRVNGQQSVDRSVNLAVDGAQAAVQQQAKCCVIL